MRIALIAAAFVAGLAGAQSQGAEACPAVDEYLKDGAKVADKDLATAIGCLADKLPDDIAKTEGDDVKRVEQIQELASKIIGNGSPIVSTARSGRFVAMSAAVIVDPKPKRAPAKSENTLDAEAIACEADKLMESIQPGRPATAKAGTCSNPVGSKFELKKYANKIIGNG